MPKFRVCLVQTVHDTCTVEVEAPGFAEAEKLAISLADNGKVEWRFLDTMDDIEVISSVRIEERAQ